MRSLSPLSSALILGLVLLVSPPPAASQAGPPTIRGQVLDPERSPLPCAEARLLLLEDNFTLNRRLLSAEPAEAVDRARCDAAGHFRLTAPGPGVYSVEVDAAGHLGARYYPLPLVHDLRLPPVHLQPAREAIFELRGAAGEPVAGALLLVTSSKSGAPAMALEDLETGWRPSSRSGHGDARGRFLAPRAPGEKLDVAITVPGRLDQPARFPAVEGGPLSLAVGDAPRHVLRVVDEDAAPRAGALALVGTEAVPVAASDEDGLLVLRGEFQEHELMKLITADGQRLDTWWVDPAVDPAAKHGGDDEGDGNGHGKGEGEAVRRLPGLEEIRGQALSIQGRAPLPGALVWSSRDPGRFVFAGEGGAYRLLLPRRSGALWLEGRHAGHLPATFEAPVRADFAGRAVDLVFETAAALRGVVVDEAGRPLEGVELLIDTPRPWPRFRLDPFEGRAVTDAEGRFAITPLWRETAYALGAFKAGFTEARLEVERPQLESPLRLVLELEKAAFGRVVDLEDRPVAGAVVRAAAVDGRRLRARAARENDPFTGVTGEDGRFELEALPAAVLDLEASGEGFAPMKVRGLDVAALAPAGENGGPVDLGPVDLGTLVLEPGARLTGRVVDEAGEPIEGASVWRVEKLGRSLRQQLEKLRLGDGDATADAEGRFVLADLTAGSRLDLVVFRSGFLPAGVEAVEVPEPGTTPRPLEVELSEAATLAGRVVDEAGEGIAGASVTLDPRVFEEGALEPTSTDGDDYQSTSTDGDGHYLFDVVTPGEYSARADSESHQTAAAVPVEIAEGERRDDVDFVLEEGAVLRGYAVTEDGEGLRGVRVTAGDAYAISRSDGYFEVLGITPGPTLVEGRFEGLPRVRRELDIGPGETETELVFSLGVEVAGRVLSASGAPLGGVWVSIQGGRFYAEYSATTDGEGRFAVDGVGPGDYRLRAQRRGFAPYERESAVRVADAPRRGVEVVLEDAGVIDGRLVGLDFDQLERAQVSASRGDLEAVGKVDYEGRFRLEDLAAGDWLVRAEVPGTGLEAHARVPLASGQEASRDLDFSSGFTLSGAVVWNGEPLPRTAVALRGLDSAVDRRTRVDHRGEFALENVPAGRYRLDASNPREVLTQNLDLEIDSDRDVVIEFDTARLTGRVLSAADGRPLGDALVILERHLDASEEPGSMSTIGTRGDGSFRFGRLARGSYTLTVRLDGFAPHAEDLEVGGDVGPLELELEPAAGLELLVRRRDGQVPPAVYVSILGPDGRPSHVEARDVSRQGLAPLPTLGAGSWRLWVAAPGAVPTQVDVEVPSEHPVPVELEPAGTLVVRVDTLARTGDLATLRVLGADGTPWRAFDPRTGDPRETWRVTAGHAEVDGLPSGQWTVRVESPSGALWEASAATAGGRETRLALE